MIGHIMDASDNATFEAVDPELIELISLFSKSLPWLNFRKFFIKHPLIRVSTDEHITLLRLIVIQEVLCLDDYALLRWVKHHYYILSFLQPGKDLKVATPMLLQLFRKRLMSIGLLDNFRGQCEKVLLDYQHRKEPALEQDRKKIDLKATRFPRLKSTFTSNKISLEKQFNRHIKNKLSIDVFNEQGEVNQACPNCSSQNVVAVKDSRKSAKPLSIKFGHCRFCGHTFRVKPTDKF